MADTKLSGLTAITGANFDVAADLLYAVDTSGTVSRKMLPEQLAIAIESKGANVASASGPDIWTVGQTKHITGAVTLTSFAAAPFAGMWRKLFFDGACLLTNGANFIVQGGANYTTVAGDMVMVYADTTTKFYLFPLRQSGAAVKGTKISSFARDMTAATGNVAYTGYGAMPRGVTFMATSGVAGSASWGADDGVSPTVIYDNQNIVPSAYVAIGGSSILLQTGSGQVQAAAVATFDADGFTLTWTKTGTPTGSATIIVTAFF